MSVMIMIISAIGVIAVVKYGLIAGVQHIVNALGWGPKAKGQAFGYVTSVPELVTLVAAALSGVWDVGLWNIASSNLINGGLMLAVITYFGQWKELRHRKFRDEIGFSLIGILAPLVLMWLSLDLHWAVVPGLFSLFVIYLFTDTQLNKHQEEKVDHPDGNLTKGVLLTVVSLVLISVLGGALGGATNSVVHQMGISSAIAGWLLGVVTSLPELVTFFSIFAASKKHGTLDETDDTQEVLDNLAASNMSNTGLIYPLGLTIFLFFG